MPYNRNIEIIEIIYIHENYLHFNIILEINICANSNTTYMSRIYHLLNQLTKTSQSLNKCKPG